jgi:hypothetical protein
MVLISTICNNTVDNENNINQLKTALIERFNLLRAKEIFGMYFAYKNNMIKFFKILSKGGGEDV